MTHAAMTPPAARASPRCRAKQNKPSEGITTPEQAARVALPGDTKEKTQSRVSQRESTPVSPNFPRRREGNVNVLARLAVIIAILAVWVALIDPSSTATRFATYQTRFQEFSARLFGSSSMGSSPAPAPAESCASNADASAVASLAPPGWAETVELFLDTARVGNAVHLDEVGAKQKRRNAQRSNARRLSAPKGVALALVVETPEDAAPGGAAAVAARAKFGCACVETFDSDAFVVLSKKVEPDGTAKQALANARGAVQSAVSLFLQKCPRGVLVVTSVQNLTPPLLTALMPAISEGGRFTRDGMDIRADGATYVFVAALGADAGVGGTWRVDGETGFAKATKTKLEKAWRLGDAGEEQDEEPGSGVTHAFRRRIDFVVPFRE